MFNRRDANVKKPSGGRPVPRRLFSIDSLKSTKSVSESDTVSITSKDTESHARNPSSASTALLRILEKPDPDNPFEDTGSVQWTDKESIVTPDEESTIIVQPQPRAKQHGLRPTPLSIDAETGVNLEAQSRGEAVPPPSPSKRRWDTIRTHVTRSSRASSLQRSGTPTISSPSPSSPPPSRPQTPVKQYRFAQKKIFRNVVDQAREVAIDESRKLAEEIRKACWTVRFGEVQLKPKLEREATQGTLGSSLHLPFMSSTMSLPMAASSSTSTVQAPQRYGQLRRPPSMQSLATGGYTPSIAHITRALTNSMSMSRPQFLPLESMVLSTLLVPFLGPHRGEHVSFEQDMAVETFEFIIRAWKAPSNEVSSCVPYIFRAR